MLASLAPRVQVTLGKTAYRPGEVLIAAIDVGNFGGAEGPPYSVDHREPLDVRHGEGILIEQILVEIRGVERLDPTWVVTPRPAAGSGKARGERIFLESTPTNIVTDVLIPLNGGKTYSVRSSLPRVLPPSYRGTAVRYTYILSVTVKWSLTKSVGNGEVKRGSASVPVYNPVVARIPVRIWTLPNASGLTTEELTAEDHYGLGGIVPLAPLTVEIQWREKNAKSNWVAATEALSACEDDEVMSRFSSSPGQSPRTDPRHERVGDMSRPRSFDEDLNFSGGSGRGGGTSAAHPAGNGDQHMDGIKEDLEVGVDLAHIAPNTPRSPRLRVENGRERTSSVGEIEELFPDNVSEDLPTSTMPSAQTPSESPPHVAAGFGNGGLPTDLPNVKVPRPSPGAVKSSTSSIYSQSSYSSDMRDDDDSALNTPTSPAFSFMRGRTYNIRIDDQILVRFTPRSPQAVYSLGDVVSGTLSFAHEPGSRRCLEVSVLLETHEIINPTVLHPSRKASGALTITKVQTEFHEVTAHLLATHFIFTIPMDAPAAFATPLVSVQWVLRFEFVASSASSSVHTLPSLANLTLEDTERGEWSMPIVVHAPRARSLAGSRNRHRRGKAASPRGQYIGGYQSSPTGSLASTPTAAKGTQLRPLSEGVAT